MVGRGRLRGLSDRDGGQAGEPQSRGCAGSAVGNRQHLFDVASLKMLAPEDIARAVMDIVADDALAGDQVTVSNAPAG